MKTNRKVTQGIWFGLCLGILACTEKPLQQTQNIPAGSVEALWEIPDPQEGKSLSPSDIEHRTRMIDYEIEKLNRLIEYHADENIDRWEQQKATLRTYRQQLRSTARLSPATAK